MPKENPPDLIKSLPLDRDGSGKKLLNGILTWIFEMLGTPGDNSLRFEPGTGGKPGKWYANVSNIVAAATTPTPFQLLQVAANSASFMLAQNSYLRKDFTNSQSTPIAGSTTAITLADGISVWLQLDTSGSSGQFNTASIQSGQTAPYENNGGLLITFAGGGTGPSDPRVWDESFTPIAQAFAADASGKPIRGGIVYTIDTKGTQLEVVQLTTSNLSLRYVVNYGALGMMALPDAAPLIS